MVLATSSNALFYPHLWILMAPCDWRHHMTWRAMSAPDDVAPDDMAPDDAVISICQSAPDDVASSVCRFLP